MKKNSRRWIQLIIAVLYNCNITGFAKGSIYQGRIKTMCVPGLNCYSCPGAVGACPIGSLQSALVSSKYRFPYYILGTLLLFGVFLGRFVCGFLCPFGMIQDLLYRIPGKKIQKNAFTRKLTCGKYIVFLIMAILIPLCLGVPGFCKYICPAGTLEGGILLSCLNPSVREMLGSLFVWKNLVLFLIILSAVFCFRSFCRFICPLGAFYSLFHRFAVLQMAVDEHKCSHCGACQRFCKMDIQKVGDRECIQCGECETVCHACAIHRTTVMQSGKDSPAKTSD
ncbi:MAG: 4Fe-4S binding protein [Oscillospiraceae bacterium]|nr:4Fe-4S binding protein [Oscillospiraceae bacterium]